jgi:hypothetical protein
MITNCRISMLFGADSPGDRTTPIENISGSDEEVLEYVRRHEAVVRAATEAQLFLTFTWRDQCNLGFEPATLSELGRLQLSLCISCVEDDPQG